MNDHSDPRRPIKRKLRIPNFCFGRKLGFRIHRNEDRCGPRKDLDHVHKILRVNHDNANAVAASHAHKNTPSPKTNNNIHRQRSSLCSVFRVLCSAPNLFAALIVLRHKETQLGC